MGEGKAIIEKAAKNARRDKPVAFGQKAHCEQYDFNERVAECFEKGFKELTKRPMESSSLVNAKTVLDQGMELLAACQKLIKIANCSEFGWRVVAEYEVDELASTVMMKRNWGRQRGRQKGRRQKEDSQRVERQAGAFTRLGSFQQGNIRLHPCPDPLVTKWHTR